MVVDIIASFEWDLNTKLTAFVTMTSEMYTALENHGVKIKENEMETKHKELFELRDKILEVFEGSELDTYSIASVVAGCLVEQILKIPCSNGNRVIHFRNFVDSMHTLLIDYIKDPEELAL